LQISHSAIGPAPPIHKEQPNMPIIEVDQPTRSHEQRENEDPCQEQGDTDTMYTTPLHLTGDEIVARANRKSAIRMWAQAKTLLENATFENAGSLESTMETIFKGISDITTTDLTLIRTSMREYLEKIRTYNDLRHTTAPQHASTSDDGDLSELKKNMEKALSDMRTSNEKKISLRKQSKDLSRKIKELKTERKTVSELISAEAALSAQIQQKISEFEEAISATEEAQAASNNRQTLARLEETLTSQRRRLLDYNLTF